MQIRFFSGSQARRLTIFLLGVFLALVAAGGMVASGQVKQVRADDTVELTYTKWFSPGYPMMVGVVGGDIEGSFAGEVLSLNPVDRGKFLLITARYEVIADDPSESFTAIVTGKQNVAKGTSVLNGVVTAGWLTGEPVQAKFRVIGCTQAPNGTCFQGTIDVTGESATDHHS